MRASSSLIPSLLLLCAVAACTGSDDDVQFTPGPSGAGAPAEGGEGGSSAEEPAPGDGGEGGGAVAGTGGKGGTSAQGGAPGKSGSGGDSGKGGSGGDSGEGGSGGDPGEGGSGGGGKGGTGAGAKGGTGGTGGGGNEPGPENTAARCGDGFDNDGDGFLDCADNDCRALLPSCREDTLAACTDGLDNDADGHIDCADFDCQKPGVGAGCAVSASCTDEHEPDDAPGQATEIVVEEGAGPACSENHQICAGDVDRYRVRFEAFESGGTLDIRLRVFSQGSGTVTVKMRDPDGIAPDVVKTLSKMPETLKLLFDTAIVCDGDCGDEVVRDLEVSYDGASKPFYRVCGEMLQAP